MAVNLSPVAGAAAQFFDNSGNVLTGGKLYTYDAGTTTPAPTYTNASGVTAQPNPIILNAAGRVPDSGEIWLADSISYKFVLKDQNDVLIGTYDNLVGINSNFVNFTGEEEQQTATQGQTIFTLTTLVYQPATNNLLVFVNGSKQISGTNYQETSSTVITFVDGLNEGDVVDFCTATPINTNVITAADVSYNQGATGAVNTNVEAKLQESVSVKDFGAVGDGTTDDTVAIQAAIVYCLANNKNLLGVAGETYAISDTLLIPQQTDVSIRINLNFCNATFKMLADVTLFASAYSNAGVLTNSYGTVDGTYNSFGIILSNFSISSNVGVLTASMLQIQDWHQGASIETIQSVVCETILEANNNFFCNYKNIQTYLFAGAGTQSRFIFDGAHNLNIFTGLIANDSQVGYEFKGPLTSALISSVSVESVGYGMTFADRVDDVLIENCYVELFTQVAFVFNGITLGATFKNNYVNFIVSGGGIGSTNFFLDYTPGPYNNITIDDDNSFVNYADENQIIFTNDSTYAQGIVFKRHKDVATTTADLLVNNSYWPVNMDWQQKKSMPGLVANVINKYVVGNYSGKYTEGYTNSHGFTFNSTGANTLRITTRIVPSDTQLIYVNLLVVWTGSPGINYIKGVFVGTSFYEFNGTGLVISTSLVASTNAFGYLQIDSGIFFGGVVTGCAGETRLI